MTDLGKPSLGRCVVLQLSAGVALTSTTHLVHRAPPVADFGATLAWAAAWALLACAAWASVVALVLLLAAVRGPDVLALCCPSRWRRAVLVATGAVLVAGAVAPAHAEGWRPPGLARPVDAPVASDGPAPARPQGGPAAEDLVVVRRGDSLWRIVARRHPEADDAVVAALVAEAYTANRAVVGADPDVLQPGERLRLPEERSPR